MRRQLEKLCEIVEAGVAAIHILRNDDGPWPGIGAFAIYSFPETEGADSSEIVYLDGDLGASIYENREAIMAVRYTFSAALSRALPVRASADLCRTVMREM